MSDLEQAWERYTVAKARAEDNPTLSVEAEQRREALRALGRAECEAGYHDDPDHSGLCIRCGADLGY